VPEAVISFLDAEGYEDAVRNAVSLGGDSDTLACITGAVAEAYYGPVTPGIAVKVQTILHDDLWLIVEQFRRRYGPNYSTPPLHGL
jgi:ADP-ribosylglycohydrolase